MNFILIYELSNREFDNLALLKSELVKRGHEVKILSKFTDFMIKHENCIAVVPNAYCNEDLDYYRYVFNLRDNPIVVYPCEQVINRKMPEFFDVSSYNLVKTLPTLCWGKDYYDFIKELGYSNLNNAIVGSINLDFCNPKLKRFYYNKEEIANKYGLPKDKKWLLFISDFVFQNVELGEHYIREGSLSEITVISMREYESYLQKEITKWFAKFMEDNPEYILIYRKHPMEIKESIVYDMEKKFPGQFFEISELGIKQWIFVSDKICTYNSTAIVECAAAQKECIYLRPKEFPPQSSITEYPFYVGYPRAKTYDDFSNAIKKETDRYKIILDKIKAQYSISDILSCKRIADVLERISKENGKSGLSMEGFEINRFLYLIKTQWIIKILVKKMYAFLTDVFKIKQRKETLLAIKEWNAVRQDKKREKEIINRLKMII